MHETYQLFAILKYRLKKIADLIARDTLESVVNLLTRLKIFGPIEISYAQLTIEAILLFICKRNRSQG